MSEGNGDGQGTQHDRDLMVAASMPEEVSSLPMDDPLRAALGLPVAQGDHLRDELEDLEAPDLDRRLMQIPESGEAGEAGEAGAHRRPQTGAQWSRLLAVAAALAVAVAGWWLGRTFPLHADRIETANPSAPSAPEVGVEAESLPPTEPAKDEGPHLIAVKIWHETCPACKIIDPRFETVTAAFNTKEVLFVTLDMSTEASRHQSGLMAEVLGIGEVYREYFGSSGFVLLVDPTTGAVVGRLTTDHDVDRMRQLLADAAGMPAIPPP